MSVPPYIYREGDSIEKVFSQLTLPFEETTFAYEMPGSQTAGYSPVFRNNASKDGLVNCVHPDLPTFYHSFQHAVEKFPTREILGVRTKNPDNSFGPYTYMSYSEIAQVRDKIGSGILALAEQAGVSGNFIVSLFSPNRREWVLTDLACHAYSLPNSPLYDTLGKASSEYILNQTESPIIFAAGNKVRKILEIDTKFLKFIVSLDGVCEEELAKTKGIRVLSFDDLIALGAQDIRPHVIPSPHTLYTVQYTSGTTATPKGVVITHGHVAAAVGFLSVHVKIPEYPVSIAFLPLAHTLERYKVCYELSMGGKIGFPHNPENPRTLLEDVAAIKPTHLCAVPRLYTRIENGLKANIEHAPGVVGKLLRACVAYKRRRLEADPVHGDETFLIQLINRFILAKVRAKLGFDNLDFLISGGGPLEHTSIMFLRTVLDCGFYQGYGLTETFAGIAISTPKDANPEACGTIGVTSEFKLRDLPEMNYTFGENRSGEFLIRGPQIFDTYFKNPEATSEALDADGWFSTGDVVRLDEQGRIKIIDRVKNFFKLAQGEYVASEKIENTYLTENSFLAQLFVYGDSFQSYLVGIVGIEPEVTVKALKKAGFTKYSTQEQLLMHLDDKELRDFVLKMMNESVKDQLFGFEKMKNVKLMVEPFKIEDDTVTPTMKIKRPVAKRFFEKELYGMYEETGRQ